MTKYLMQSSQLQREKKRIAGPECYQAIMFGDESQIRDVPQPLKVERCNRASQKSKSTCRFLSSDLLSFINRRGPMFLTLYNVSRIKAVYSSRPLACVPFQGFNKPSPLDSWRGIFIMG
jgi:hypothetical protein